MLKFVKTLLNSSPDLSAPSQVFDRSAISAKFEPPSRHAGGGRVVLPRVSGAPAAARLGLAGARRQRQADDFEQAPRRGRSVSAHQPIGAAMADANLGEAVELAQQVLLLRGQSGLARKIGKRRLRRQREERAEHAAVDRRVGGMGRRNGRWVDCA